MRITTTLNPLNMSNPLRNPLGFPSLPARGVPLQPRPASTPPKRGRSDTSCHVEPTLPPARRVQTKPIKPTSSYMFTGLHPLYRREVIPGDNEHMTIYCTVKGCTKFIPKVIKRALSGTNNYKSHYHRWHSGIPTCLEEEDLQKAANPSQPFFRTAESEQTENERYRDLLLLFITKNNLSFSLVDQPETRALFTFLNPKIKQISRRTLRKDIQLRYEEGEAIQKKKLESHVNAGGRIALTTDGWSGNNKLDYEAVTAHYKTIAGDHESLLLDIIELTDPSHTGSYLCKKLLEVTDRMEISHAVISVTRDNAAPNDTMLYEYEATIAERYDEMGVRDQAYFFCRFNRVEGDVRCCAHIYNIAVQAGMFDVSLGLH